MIALARNVLRGLSWSSTVAASFCAAFADAWDGAARSLDRESGDHLDDADVLAAAEEQVEVWEADCSLLYDDVVFAAQKFAAESSGASSHPAPVGSDPVTPRAGSDRPVSPDAVDGSQQQAAGVAGEVVGAGDDDPGAGADHTTSALLEAAVNQLNVDRKLCTCPHMHSLRADYLDDLIPELRDLAAQFRAIHD